MAGHGMVWYDMEMISWCAMSNFISMASHEIPWDYSHGAFAYETSWLLMAPHGGQ